MTDKKTDKKNEIIKRPFLSQFNYIESWLQDKAKAGWILRDYEMGRYTFEAGKPNNRRYRVVSVMFFKREKEIAKWEAYGWKHFPTGLGTQIFYTDDEQLQEVYPNKDSFRQGMLAELIRLIISVLVMIVLLFIWFRIQYKDFIHEIEFSKGELTYLIMCATPLVAFWLYATCEALRGIYQILSSKPINHNASYRRNMKIGKMVYVGLFVTLGLCILGGIALCF